MPLADELLAQAHLLATIDTGVPAQANLRRAISAAYYALFHLLISECVNLLVPEQPRGLRERTHRAFSHSEMQKVCFAIVKRDVSEKLGVFLAGGISGELRLLAETFSFLQQARHLADYDVATPFSRAATLSNVEKADNAFASWNRIRDTEEATVFLTALAFGARWSK